MTTLSMQWQLSDPIYKPRPHSTLRSHACKDPTIVRHEGRWHMFTTVRDQRQNLPYIEYAAFSDWSVADQAPRFQMNAIHDHKFAAPQVFYYRPHRMWYLVFQAFCADRKKPQQPMFSCNKNINDPTGWSVAQPFFAEDQPIPWLDFWVMGDGKLMYLFFTGCSGYFAMSTCSYDAFPFGFSAPRKVIEDRGEGWMLFEASHTYKIKDKPWYVSIIEGLSHNRYFQLYVTKDMSSGNWTPIHVKPDDAFAAANNVDQEHEWTANISHGECIRSGIDERLEIPDTGLQMLIQGVDDPGYRQNYIKIPWQLGLLSAGAQTSLSALIESRL